MSSPCTCVMNRPDVVAVHFVVIHSHQNMKSALQRSVIVKCREWVKPHTACPEDNNSQTHRVQPSESKSSTQNERARPKFYPMEDISCEFNPRTHLSPAVPAALARSHAVSLPALALAAAFFSSAKRAASLCACSSAAARLASSLHRHHFVKRLPDRRTMILATAIRCQSSISAYSPFM